MQQMQMDVLKKIVKEQIGKKYVKPNLILMSTNALIVK
jgi:hypothetical protein